MNIFTLFCQHSYNDFEKGVSLIQGPSSLAGQSCYLSADFDGVVLNHDGPGFWANKCLKVIFTVLLSRERCGVGKTLSLLTVDCRSYKIMKLKSQ